MGEWGQHTCTAVFLRQKDGVARCVEAKRVASFYYAGWQKATPERPATIFASKAPVLAMAERIN